MIEVILPSQYLPQPGARRTDPHRRLMVAVLQAVIDDCRGSQYRHARGSVHPVGQQDARKAAAYVASTDRQWAFSYENICDALEIDARSLRKRLLDVETLPARA